MDIVEVSSLVEQQTRKFITELSNELCETNIEELTYDVMLVLMETLEEHTLMRRIYKPRRKT